MASEKKSRGFVAIPLGDTGQAQEGNSEDAFEHGLSWTFALHLALRYSSPRRPKNRKENESSKVK